MERDRESSDKLFAVFLQTANGSTFGGILPNKVDVHNLLRTTLR